MGYLLWNSSTFSSVLSNSPSSALYQARSSDLFFHLTRYFSRPYGFLDFRMASNSHSLCPSIFVGIGSGLAWPGRGLVAARLRSLGWNISCIFIVGGSSKRYEDPISLITRNRLYLLLLSFRNGRIVTIFLLLRKTISSSLNLIS